MFVPHKTRLFPILVVYLFIALCFSLPAILEDAPREIPHRHLLKRDNGSPSLSSQPTASASVSDWSYPVPTAACTVEEQAPIDCTLIDIWKSCVNGYKGPWQSAQNAPYFPTVNDIKTDMLRCGNIGQTGPTIFYSFGTRTPEARGFRDTLTPVGNMFNDVLPGDWFVGSGSVGEAINIVAADRQALLVARYGQAMAELSKGEVFLVVPPFADPYTPPLDPPGVTPNVWRNYEFPTLQRNTDITQVTRVINAPPYDRSPGWLPNDPKYSELPPSNADSQVSALLCFFPKKKCVSHRSHRLVYLTTSILSLCHPSEVNRHQYCHQHCHRYQVSLPLPSQQRPQHPPRLLPEPLAIATKIVVPLIHQPVVRMEPAEVGKLSSWGCVSETGINDI